MPVTDERCWAADEDEAIRDLTHWTMRGGRDKSINRRGWHEVAEIMNGSDTANIMDGRRRNYNETKVANRYTKYIKIHYETEAEWAARVARTKAEVADKEERMLWDITMNTKGHKKLISKPLEADQPGWNVKHQDEKPNGAAGYLKQDVQLESFVADVKADRTATHSGEAHYEKQRAFNPFDGAPLSPNFPKTPIDFSRGKLEKAMDKATESHDTLSKPFNPFEGVPLSQDFPKTPMNFYKGEVVVKGCMATEKQAVEATKDVRAGRNTQKPLEVIMISDDEEEARDEELKPKRKRVDISMLLNDDL